MTRVRKTALSKVHRALRSDHVTGWAFAFPAVFLIFLFGIIPIAWAGLLSFQKTNLLAPPVWVGLRNYEALTRDPLFRESVTHTLIFSGLYVPLSVIGGLIVAIALNRKIRAVRFYRTAVIVPLVASTIATSLMFLWLFDSNFGLVNWVLEQFGFGPFGFFESADGALGSIVAVAIWGSIGFNVIIYMAALQGIPGDLIEAAEIDGAGRVSVYRRIVLPLLGPATLFLVVWSTINALQLFDQVYFLTRGGPATSTYVVVYYLFDLAFQKGVAGYAAAIAAVLFLVILVLTIVQLWVGKKMVYYAS